MDVRITVHGLDEILQDLRSAPRIIGEELDDAVDTALGAMLQELAKYPAPPPGSRYRRTYTLRSGWLSSPRRLRGGAGGIHSAFVTNPTPYARWVQGDDQAWMHKSRWKSVETVQREMEPNTQRVLNRAVERIVERMLGR